MAPIGSASLPQRNERKLEMLTVKAVSSINSCDFVSRVFEILDRGECFAAVSGPLPVNVHQLDLSAPVQPKPGGGWYEGNAYVPNSSPSPAQIAFSSGTEGKPKAIVISHAALENTTSRIISVMGIEDSIREYVGIPVYHSFGFGRCRVVSAAGGRFYLPENGFSVREIADLLGQDRINAISAVPSLWRILLGQGEIIASLGTKIRWVEIGSQYMSAEEKVALRDLFPNAKIVQHYGLTEASRTTFLEIHETQGAPLESVGKVLFGVAVAIGNEGEIRIKGPHLSDRILSETGSMPVADSDGWLSTNDLGRIVDGYLYFEGRRDDQINCGGVKLSPELLEADVKQDTGINSGWGIIGVAHSVRGEVPIIVFEESARDQLPTLTTATLNSLREKNVNIGTSIETHLIEEIPRTNTGKIKRKELRATVMEQTRKSGSQTRDFGSELAKDPSELDLLRGFELLLGQEGLSGDANFVTAGGDSLAFLQGAMLVEKYHGRTVPGWETIPFAQLVDRAASSTLEAHADVLVVVRAVAVWLMMFSHAAMEFGLWKSMHDGVHTLTKLATPCFVIVFGMGVARTWSERISWTPKSMISAWRVIVPKAVILYAAIVVVESGLLLRNLNFEYFVNVLLLSDYGRFVQILMLYLLFMLSIPLWVPLVQRRGVVIPTVLLLGIPLVHQSVKGASTGAFLSDLMIGTANFLDPGLLMTFLLVMYGFVLATSERDVARKVWAALTATAAAGVCAYGFTTSSHSDPFSWAGAMRKSDLTYYAFGIVGFLAVYGACQPLAKHVDPGRSAVQYVLSAGYAPLQIYVLGNWLLNVGPGRYAWVLPAWGNVLVVVLYLLTLAYAGRHLPAIVGAVWSVIPQRRRLPLASTR